jgi:hypothetical protein
VRARLLVVAALAVVAAAGCGRKHIVDPAHDSPRDPLTPGALPAPAQPGAVTVEAIGVDLVTLRWTMSDSSNVTRYRIYRSDPESPEPTPTDSSAIQRVTVRGLQVGVTYGFRVAAVSSSGLEGPRSQLVLGRPAVLSIAINGSAAVTNDPQVVVEVTATGFNQVRLAESVGALSTATYVGIPLSGAVGFTFGGADGARSLFGQFRDTGSGNESSVVSDEILLDRVATIESASQNTADQVRTAGDVIHFTLIANEVDGAAFVDIGQARASIRLFDDGTNGDGVPGNGVYEVNYTVEPTIDCNQVPVTGRFVDRAGNAATPLQAAGTVTIRNPPPAVTLLSAVAQAQGRVQLQWTQSGALDFQAYHLWHAGSSPVLASGSRSLDTTITVRATTNATVKGLSPGNTYYFLVEVADLSDNRTASNERSTTATVAGEAPSGARLGVVDWRDGPATGPSGVAATRLRAVPLVRGAAPRR